LKPTDRGRVKRLEALELLESNKSGGSILQRTPLGPIAFIDPANVSGVASDSNTGATNNNIPAGSGPILTTAHLNSLLFMKRLPADRIITYMSDDAAGASLDFSTIDFNGFNLIFQGTIQVLHTGGAFNAGTVAINPFAAGGGQRQLVHVSDLATFAPFVFNFGSGTAPHPTKIVDTSGLNAGTGAWIVSGTATASTTRPISPSNYSEESFVGPAAVFTIGDSYQIVRGSLLTLATSTGYTNTNTSGAGGQAVFNDFAFTASSGGNTLCGGLYQRCSFEAPLVMGGAFLDCYCASGAVMLTFTPAAIIVLQAGLFVTTGADGWAGYLVLFNDVYLTGLGLALDQQTGFVNVSVGLATITGAGTLQLQDNTFLPEGPQGALSFLLTANLGNNLGLLGEEAPSLIWGNGNAGLGVAVGPGATGGLTAALGFVPSVTGTLGDFGFIGENGGAAVTVARAWNEAAGAYTEAGGPATRTTTWAHFAATIGAGGFGFAAINPATNAALIGV